MLAKWVTRTAGNAGRSVKGHLVALSRFRSSMERRVVQRPLQFVSAFISALEEILSDALPCVLAELVIAYAHVDPGLKSGVDIARAVCCQEQDALVILKHLPPSLHRPYDICYSSDQYRASAQATQIDLPHLSSIGLIRLA